MKHFICGLIIGIVIGGTIVVYADVGVLFGSDNIEKGTITNPIVIQNI